MRTYTHPKILPSRSMNSSRPPVHLLVTSKGLPPGAIRFLLKVRNLPIREVSSSLGIPMAWVHQVIARKRRDKRVRAYLHRQLAPMGLSYAHIWGIGAALIDEGGIGA